MLVVRLADETAAFLPSGTLESFRADLGLSYAQAGTVLALIAPGALLGSGFSAAADRFSRRVIASGGAFGFAVALAGFAAGWSFLVMGAAALLMGAASTAMLDGTEVALVEVAGDDLRRYLARSNFLGTVGGLVGPALIAGVAAVGLSWRVAFWVGAGLLALYGCVLAATPFPAPSNRSQGEDADGGDKPSTARARLGAVLRDPAVWVIGLIGLLLNPFDEPLVGFTIALMEEDRGAPAALATVVALVGLCGGLLSYTVLARRYQGADDGRVLLGSVTAMTAGALLIPLAPVLPVVAAGIFVASVGLNLGWLALQHRSLTLRPGQVGTTQAVLGAIEIAGFWIPIAIGAVADAAGLASAVGTYAALGAVLIVLAHRLR